MPVELQKDMFTVDQIIGQETAQAIIEGDILVPDIKPDITRIISVDGAMEVTKKEVLENKINVEGVIKFKILYVSDRGEEPLYSIDSSTVFKYAIPIEGITSKMKAEVQGDLEHIEYVINNERKIGVKAVVNLFGTAIEGVQQQVAREVTGLEDIQVLREEFQYTEVAGEAVSEALVKDTFELEDQESPVKEILKWNAVAVEKETKISEDKVIAAGTLLVELLYIADDEMNSLNILKKEIPFTHFTEIANIDDSMKYKIKLSVEELYTDVKETLQGERKIIEVEAVTKSAVKVLDTRTRELIVDAYSPSKSLKVGKNLVSLKENIGMNRSHVMLREALDVPTTQPEIDRLFSVQVRPLLTDYHIVDEKAVIEGILEASVIYVSQEDLQPLYSFKQEIPFRHYVDMVGLIEGMEANIDLQLEEVDYHLLNGTQVDIKVTVGASCEAYTHKYIEVVHSIEELEESQDPAKRPSLTVYFMQPGDTLWQVAKRYQTTVKQILESNQLVSPEDVTTGDYILIEKVHNFNF
ncbi:DUF3794 and LysM peptidoglycan-binding domain-containing protein [Alkaliphilus crotonatoxidans]